MPTTRPDAELQSPAVETYLLGHLGHERCLQLQRRLIRGIAGRDDGQIALLLCEHPAIITIGRAGSPEQVARESSVLASRQIEVCWVNRGGPCTVHCPGQLAIYPLVPLPWHGFSVGEYLQRLQAGLVETLDDLNVRGHTRPGRWGVWGRTGQLAALGVAVRDWVTYYGAWLNVCPAMGLFKLVETDPLEHTPMSCLLAERRSAGRMTTVRAALVRRLAEAFGCERYHLYTGHPMLRRGRRRAGDG